MCLRYSTSHYISKTKPGIVKDKIYKKPASYSLFCFGKKKIHSDFIMYHCDLKSPVFI